MEIPVQNHLGDMQRYLANVAVTPSALRNLGAGGLVRTAREFLGNLDLKPLASLDPSAYPEWLEDQTRALRARFPVKDLWGPARKSINIFMVMASLNIVLCNVYALERFEHVLEVPLDNVVERKLRKFGRNRQMFSDEEFPKWNGIKRLDSMNSEKYQKVAQTVAKQRGIPRGRLDIALWEPANS
jgi:hypothetical protein